MSCEKIRGQAVASTSPMLRLAHWNHQQQRASCLLHRHRCGGSWNSASATNFERASSDFPARVEVAQEGNANFHEIAAGAHQR